MNNTAIEKREGTQANLPERADQAQHAQQATYFTPLVDVIETGDGFTFLADLPGVKADDVDVRYENNVLTIAGRVPPRQAPGTGYLWREYGVGHFYRSFTLNTPIHADGITAELRNGELKLYAPKAESAKVRKIEIKSGA